MPDPTVMHGVLRHLRRTERRRLYQLLGDRELLVRFVADRDEAAFEEIVTRHGPMVRAVCRRVLGPSADADDAFQAAFLVFLRRARSIRRADLLAGWLCAVAYRTARQALRRRSRLDTRERLMDQLPEPTRTDDPPQDWLPLFDAALQRLPSKYRDPVVLCELQGISRRDASVRLGLTEGTLSSRLGRARDLLRRKLGRNGFPLAVGSALAPSVVPEAFTASTVAAAAHVSAASVSAVVLTEGVLAAMLASKLKAGALAGTAVLVLGVVAGVQFSGRAVEAGGPPANDGAPVKETPRPTAKAPPAAPKAASAPTRMAAEYEPFQGEWMVIAAGDGGRFGIDTLGIDERWKIVGDSLSTGSELKEDAAEPFVVGVGVKPSTIDFALTRFDSSGTGALARTTYLGIFKFEPDGRLLIAYRVKSDGAKRPTRFATAPGAGVTLLELQRPNREPPPPPTVDIPSVNELRPVAEPVRLPPPANPAKDADLGKVVGAWELADVDGQSPDAVAGKLDARPHPAGGQRSKQRWEALRRLQLLPARGPTDLVNQAGSQSFVAYVDLDGSRAPKWFTLFATEETRDAPPGGTVSHSRHTIRLCGIYKLDGEKLVICLPEAEGPPLLRPTDFAGDGEGGVYLLTYQRASKNWKPDVRVSPKPVPGPLVDTPPGVMIPPFRADDLSPMIPGTPPAGVGSVPVGVAPPGAIAPNLPTPTGIPAPVVGNPPPATDSFVPSVPGPALMDPAISERSSISPVEVPSPPAPPQTDLDRLQGTWVMNQIDGKLPAGNEPTEALEFLQNRVLSSDGKHGRVRLDESKSPRQITIWMGKQQPNEGMTGIYKLEGDRLTIATSSRSAKLIPTGFEPDAEAGISVTVYVRPKPPSVAPTGTPKDTPKVGPPKAPERDLQKEIDQLRDQLKRLEKELKDRTY